MKDYCDNCFIEITFCDYRIEPENYKAKQDERAFRSQIKCRNCGSMNKRVLVFSKRSVK